MSLAQMFARQFGEPIEATLHGDTVRFLSPDIAALVIAWLAQSYEQWLEYMDKTTFEFKSEADYLQLRSEQNRRNFRLACLTCAVSSGGNLWDRVKRVAADLPL